MMKATANKVMPDAAKKPEKQEQPAKPAQPKPEPVKQQKPEKPPQKELPSCGQVLHPSFKPQNK